MSKVSRILIVALQIGLVSGGAYARTLSDVDIRKQCYDEATKRWPSMNQEMQTNRDFTYRACVVDHGVGNP